MGVVGDWAGLSAAAAGEAGTLRSGLEFIISSRRFANGTFVVAAGGEVDLGTAPELERALAGPLAEGATQLVVDLSVVVQDPNVRKVFEVTGVGRFFSVASSLSTVSVPS